MGDSATRQQWAVVAQEERPGRLQPLEPWQRQVLERLAEMMR